MLSSSDYDTVRILLILLDSVIESQHRVEQVWEDFRMDNLREAQRILDKIVEFQEGKNFEI